MTKANDRYEQFYAEKLWELVPSIHRHEDGSGEHPGTMRAFIELIAEQAALLRRSHDRLWDDAYIDLCDDWAVPYLGDLVATRMVSALNPRGRRVDVAKTIYYRRRKGTPRVLEELIADITGWEGKVVESYRFLGRCAHRLDLSVAERVDPSPGWADLRSVRVAALADSAWDPFAHTADIRRSHGRAGRWNIPKASFHLFRLAAIAVRGATPHLRADGKTATFDPSGRDLQLFMPRHRDASFQWDEQWESARPWEVPAPMGCRVLGHAEYVVEPSLLVALGAAGTSAAAVAELATVRGVRFSSETALHQWLAASAHSAELLAPGNYDRIRAGALITSCGKAALWHDGVAVAPTGGLPTRRERMAAGTLEPWRAPPADHDLLVDPQRGRFSLTAALAQPARARVEYCYGFGGRVGAGGYDRRARLVAPDLVVPAAGPGGGTLDTATFPKAGGRWLGAVELPDSATYTVANAASAVAALTVQSANFERPYVRLTGDWVFTAAPGVDATLVLDGLWLGASPPAAVVLRGAWKSVVIRNATLDPGGVDADGATLPPVPLWVEGSVERLELSAAICSTIGARAGGEIGALEIADSIVDGHGAAGPAILVVPGELRLTRVTVLGGVRADHLDATEALITDLVTVTDTQHGCFRFSAAPEGSRLPHPYRWFKWTGGPVFVSSQFGDAGYTWLAESAPIGLSEGGEHGAEIGVWRNALNPIKQASLLRKVEEYLPFGLVPMFIRET